MNAAALRAFDDRAAVVGEGLFPGEVLFDGETEPVAVTVTSQAWAEQLEVAGAVVSGNFKCLVRKALREVQPVENALFTFRGQRMRVLRVLGTGDADANWRIEGEIC